MVTNCTCQTKSEQGVLLGCQNCIDGSVCIELYQALKEISEGKGRYSTDPLTYASNVIEDMITIAKQALAKAEGK